MDKEHLKAILRRETENRAIKHVIQTVTGGMSVRDLDENMIDSIAEILITEAEWDARISASYAGDRQCMSCGGPIEENRHETCIKCGDMQIYIRLEAIFGREIERIEAMAYGTDLPQLHERINSTKTTLTLLRNQMNQIVEHEDRIHPMPGDNVDGIFPEFANQPNIRGLPGRTGLIDPATRGVTEAAEEAQQSIEEAIEEFQHRKMWVRSEEPQNPVDGDVWVSVSRAPQERVRIFYRNQWKRAWELDAIQLRSLGFNPEEDETVEEPTVVLSDIQIESVSLVSEGGHPITVHETQIDIDAEQRPMQITYQPFPTRIVITELHQYLSVFGERPPCGVREYIGQHWPPVVIEVTEQNEESAQLRAHLEGTSGPILYTVYRSRDDFLVNERTGETMSPDETPSIRNTPTGTSVLAPIGSVRGVTEPIVISFPNPLTDADRNRLHEWFERNQRSDTPLPLVVEGGSIRPLSPPVASPEDLRQIYRDYTQRNIPHWTQHHRVFFQRHPGVQPADNILNEGDLLINPSMGSYRVWKDRVWTDITTLGWEEITNLGFHFTDVPPNGDDEFSRFDEWLVRRLTGRLDPENPFDIPNPYDGLNEPAQGV